MPRALLGNAGRPREQDGRSRHSLSGPADLHEAAQIVEQRPRQTVDRRTAVQGLAIGPGELQPLGQDDGREVEQPAAPATRAARGPGRLRHHAEALLRANVGHLAEVQEGQLGLRQGAQPLREPGRARQVAQQAVAQAAAGHGAHRVADPLEVRERIGRSALRQLEQQRIGGGEPAHGARQVDLVAQRLAAEPLQIEQEGALAGPPAEGPGEGGEQELWKSTPRARATCCCRTCVSSAGRTEVSRRPTPRRSPRPQAGPRAAGAPAPAAGRASDRARRRGHRSGRARAA